MFQMTNEQQWQRASRVRLLAPVELLSDRVLGLALAQTAALAEQAGRDLGSVADHAFEQVHANAEPQAGAKLSEALYAGDRRTRGKARSGTSETSEMNVPIRHSSDAALREEHPE
jgi:hypothetical protein